MRFLRSASVMSWSAMLARLGGFAAVLAVAVSHLTDAELSVWLLFSAIASLQLLVDFGFSATFSREIAYGFAGGSTISLPSSPAAVSPPAGSDRTTDWNAIGRTVAAMRWMYFRLAWVALGLLAVLGSWAVAIPIERAEAGGAGWIAWGLVAVGTTFAVMGSTSPTLLVGANRVDLLKRWETAIAVIFIPAQLAALLSGGGLLGLVAAAQLGLLTQVCVNSWLARRIMRNRSIPPVGSGECRRLVNELWPAAWRTAAGAITSFGVAQGMAIAVANLLAAGEAASVQLALRLVQTLSQFSQVPFYSKIPLFNRLRAAGDTGLLTTLAANAMRSSLGIFAVSAILIGLLCQPVLSALESNTAFPGSEFWSLLTLAYLFERIGAMHVQLLLTRNIVIAHIANPMTSAVWVCLLAAFWPHLGVTALPVSMLVAYAGVYVPFVVRPSRAALETRTGIRFALQTSVLPAVIMALYLWLSIRSD